MLWSIPASEAEIYTSHEGDCVVDYTDFLVMSEEELILLKLIRRSLYENIGMQVKHREFGELRIDGYCSFHVPVNDDEDFNTLSGLPLEQSI